MKNLLITLSMILFIAGGVAAADGGITDTLLLAVTPGDLDVVAGDSAFTVELYCYHDVDTLTGLSCGFEWFHDGLVLDSVKRSPAAIASFDFTPYYYYKNNRDSTNAAKKFMLGLTRMSAGFGLLGGASRQLMASYYFHVNSFDPATDSIVFDTLKFSPGSTFQLTSSPGGNYIPVWTPSVKLLDVSDVAGDNSSNLPTKFAVEQNYPNPFNPSTTIAYDVPKASHVKVEVYNVLGQSVKTLVNEPKAPGSYEVVWNGSSDGGHKVASGIYFYRFTADNNVVDTRKMMLLK